MSTARKAHLDRDSLPDPRRAARGGAAHRRAARVDVQVIVPKEGDSKLVTMASHTYCESLRQGRHHGLRVRPADAARQDHDGRRHGCDWSAPPTSTTAASA
jgi:hypothetical protein